LGQPIGPYVVQAGIAACHARARTAQDTDWPAIVALYETLSRIAPSPIVALNHAVAVSMVSGPQAGLHLVDDIADHPALTTYPLLPAVRADLLARLGRHSEARPEYLRAAALTANTRERDVLIDRAGAGQSHAPPAEA
jgi:RNA polymerase sigma-70 factor (ECF subfamily)